MKYQTIKDLKSSLEAMNDKVINFKKYPEYKEMPFRDRCLANWGTTGDFVINQKAGNFGGTMRNSYK